MCEHRDYITDLAKHATQQQTFEKTIYIAT
jgi:hypothetical protein